MNRERARGKTVRSNLCLSPDCSPKLLEEPAIYNRASDELYFVNRQALDFLVECGQGRAGPCRDAEAGFLRFCLAEGILDRCPDGPAEPREFTLRQSPMPSLRYLLLHITDRCNLRCRHCFVGEPGKTDMAPEDIAAVADEFEEMQGLRLMLSGGEPLLHRNFPEFDAYLARKDIRVILLTNGTLIDEEVAGRLQVDEVQVSLDGLERSHDLLRGDGSFGKAVSAIKLLRQADIDVSVATMIHSHNLDELDGLARLVRRLDVRQWSVDLPSPAGRMKDDGDLSVEPCDAAPSLDLSYGGSIHEPLPGFACGAHLMAVMAGGGAARCGFYGDSPVGHIREGLAECWQQLSPIPLAELECDCDFIDDCRGGCRFRADGYKDGRSPDLCQCYRYGVLGDERPLP
jgi:MoaA/NifB/PqqE/SkfB family radical SAM enzyme